MIEKIDHQGICVMKEKFIEQTKQAFHNFELAAVSLHRSLQNEWSILLSFVYLSWPTSLNRRSNEANIAPMAQCLELSTHKFKVQGSNPSASNYFTKQAIPQKGLFGSASHL
uniref:Uncharacterized protein n=1 Tax=Romanomermis culicivorax TaxID=13658 RepID=A0A915HL55_ROMCU